MGTSTITLILENLIVGLVALALGFFLKQYLSGTQLKSKEDEAKRLLTEAQTKVRAAELEAKAVALKIREEAEAEIKRHRMELQRQEQRLQHRRESIEHKFDALEKRERKLEEQEKLLERERAKIAELRQAQISELQRISGLSAEEAKTLLLKSVEEEARQDMARVIREVEAQAEEEAERKAREIITLAIQRVASDQVTETTVSTVPLPSDEMKGRIIGRGGRNIRTIENITGVDLVVDDTPEAVIISSFDPVRREVARVALNKLILDGRIHPARIEKVVQKAQQEVEAIIREEGERAAYECGLPGLHPELIKLLGTLHFRTSYGQNVLQHSIETAHLAGIMAAELGADVALAKEAALLHDIGKAVDHQVEGPHALIGGDIAKRLGKSPKIVNAIAAHHGEEEPQSVEAILVQAADAISGARPGARRETLESYIKRIQALETVADSFPGVEKSYAIQAGREVRIIVKPEEIDDLAAIRLSRDIAKKIEESLEYPGQIKVTVIRETRAVDYAK
ncbi:MAG: ribonuclease Y [Chloroflexi bacterium]|nr:ribonuclease Y [Chloroflexota bacterium]